MTDQTPSCEQCEKYSDYIADLRNKFGRIYSYFQILEVCEQYEGTFAKAEQMRVELEKEIPADIEFFVKLLKTDIKDWEWKEKP